MVLVSPQNWAQQMYDGTESRSGTKIIILTFQGYRKTILYFTHSSTPIFRSTSRTLRYQSFAAMVEHRSGASKTLLRFEHVVTDNESSSSEGASEGDTYEHDRYNADKEITMSDQEGVISSKRSPHGTHSHVCE